MCLLSMFSRLSIYSMYQCFIPVQILFYCMKKVKVLVLQSCPTLWDPIDCNLPGSSVHGILQARILEWVAIPFSRGSSHSVVWTYHILFIHLPTDGHLGCFYFLTVINNAINIHIWVFVWTYGFNCLGYIHRSEIPGSYGYS